MWLKLENPGEIAWVFDGIEVKPVYILESEEREDEEEVEGEGEEKKRSEGEGEGEGEALFIKGWSACISSSLKGSGEKTWLLLEEPYVSITAAIDMYQERLDCATTDEIKIKKVMKNQPVSYTKTKEQVQSKEKLKTFYTDKVSNRLWATELEGHKNNPPSWFD